MEVNPFCFSVVELITLDEPVVTPIGIVYSTRPHRAEGEDRRSYVIKGEDSEVIFAELGGLILANAAGLCVPDAAICRFETVPYAGSCFVEGVRDLSSWLKRPSEKIRFDDLFSIIVVDIWLCNPDRNMGNLIGRQANGKLEIVAIDFEKSVALKRTPTIRSANQNPRTLWPPAELGELARRRKPLHPPDTTIRRIESLDAARCRDLLLPLNEAFPEAVWFNDAVHAVSSRASDIRQLVEEVWKLN